MRSALSKWSHFHSAYFIGAYIFFCHGCTSTRVFNFRIHEHDDGLKMCWQNKFQWNGKLQHDKKHSCKIEQKRRVLSKKLFPKYCVTLTINLFFSSVLFYTKKIWWCTISCTSYFERKYINLNLCDQYGITSQWENCYKVALNFY